MRSDLARREGESVGALLLRWRDFAGLARAAVTAATKKAGHYVTPTRLRNIEMMLRKPAPDDLDVLAAVYADHYGESKRAMLKVLRDATQNWKAEAVQSDFGKLLRSLRETAGPPRTPGGHGTEVSLRELSDRTIDPKTGKPAVSHAMLWEVEHGFREAPRNPAKMRALAKALGNTTVEELVQAAGFGRQALSKTDRPDLEAVLASKGLNEDSIAEVQQFIDFVYGQQRKAARKSS